MHAMFSAGLYEREQEEKRRQEEEEAQRLEELKTDQSRTRCYDSEQCASGFACVGGKCAYVDPTGATGDGGTAGCGAGVGGSGGSGGGGAGGSGCGGPAASSGGSGAVASIQACSTSSAGSCLGVRGSQSGNSGGGGGRSCGETCCQCSGDGCVCFAGRCPPPPSRCSRFCTEAEGLGAGVMGCGPYECGLCEYCDDSIEVVGGDPVCKRRTYDVDCRCDYKCPGCMQCSSSGNCLIKNCPPPPKPPEEPPNNCEPECRDTEVCVTNSSTGEVTCSTVQQCGDLPEECEPCDCNCSGDCPDCYICNSAGKCVPDPACDEDDCQPDSITVTLIGGSASYERRFSRFAACPCCDAGGVVDQKPTLTKTYSTDCGPLSVVIMSSPEVTIEDMGLCSSNYPQYGQDQRGSVTGGVYNVINGRGEIVGIGSWGGVGGQSGAIRKLSFTPGSISW